MNATQEQNLLSIPACLYGEHYPVVSVFYFNALVDDLYIRSIIDPLLFIFQRNAANTVFKFNINPTPEQIPALKKFVEIAQGKIPLAHLPFTPVTKALPNETQPR